MEHFVIKQNVKIPFMYYVEYKGTINLISQPQVLYERIVQEKNEKIELLKQLIPK